MLTDEHSLSYLGALPRMFAAVGLHLEDLLAAYRSGGGVSWAQLGADARESQAATNRPWFESELGPALAGVPEAARGAVHARLPDRRRRLRRGLVHPRARPGLSRGDGHRDRRRRAVGGRGPGHAEEAGLTDRVSFADPAGAGWDQPDTFDAAFVFEALHDMPRPVEVLAALRRDGAGRRPGRDHGRGGGR